MKSIGHEEEIIATLKQPLQLCTVKILGLCERRIDEHYFSDHEKALRYELNADEVLLTISLTEKCYLIQYFTIQRNTSSTTFLDTVEGYGNSDSFKTRKPSNGFLLL